MTIASETRFVVIKCYQNVFINAFNKYRYLQHEHITIII